MRKMTMFEVSNGSQVVKDRLGSLFKSSETRWVTEKSTLML